MPKETAQAYSKVLVQKLEIAMLQHGQILLVLCPEEQIYINLVQVSYFHTSYFSLFMQKKIKKKKIMGGFLSNDVL